MLPLKLLYQPLLLYWVDDSTKACVSLKYVRDCVELDAIKPTLDSIRIALPNNQGYWKSIIVETKLSYYTECMVHGHNLASCQKLIVASNILKDKNNPEPREVTMERGTNMSVTILGIPAKEKNLGDQWVCVGKRKSSIGKEPTIESAPGIDKFDTGPKTVDNPSTSSSNGITLPHIEKKET